jgi:hypothetical protein
VKNNFQFIIHHPVGGEFVKMCIGQTPKIIFFLRTIWTNNRGHVRDLIVKFSQSQAEDTTKSSSEDSIQVTHDNQQSRKLRIHPRKKRYSAFEEPKCRKVTYCICKSVFSTVSSPHMLQCQSCKEWYHTNQCLGLGKLVDQIPGKQIKFECGLLGCSAEPLLLVNKVNQTHQLKKISEEKQSNTGSAVSSDTSSAKSICSTPDNQDSTSQEEQIISHTPSSPTKSILPVDSPATDKSDDPSVTYSRATSSKISSEEYGATSDAQSSSSHSNSNEHKRIPTVPEQ